MDNYILTCFHHGGCVVGNPNSTYQREVDVFGVGIDKDHFSLVEFLSYTKDLGYTNVKGFYCEDNNELVQVTSDNQLLEFVKDLVDGDEFHVYVVHEVDELEELPASTGLLQWSDPVDESVGINTKGTVENDSDLNEVDTELPGGDTNQNKAESDLPSSDTDVDVIPDEDDLDVDEELRSLRAERRNKRNPNLRKKRDKEKKTINKEVPIGEAGADRGFEDIGINKKDRYIGRLGGDEKYIDSSECDSDDSTDMLDAEAVGGVDLLGRRKSKKVRHIWSNWSKRWKGEERRKQFWRCSKATFEVKYSEELYKMSRLGNEINDDLLHYPQVSWVRAFFQEHSKCDAVENNMCETFNSWILSCRHKSIITMLEEIRRKLMTRIVDMVKFADTWICDIAPMARLMLEENKEKSRACKVLWNANIGFEIGEGQYRHTVNLTNRVCNCRTWQLRGIPCQHAISALYHIEQEPEPLMEHWYRKDTFLKAYSHFIQPISNMKMWPETNNPRIEPPEPKQMPGRPPRNKRKTSHSSQFTAGQISQGSCHPEPTSSFQPGPTIFNQPASTTSNSNASSTTVCGDTSRVKKARETAKTSQPPPFVNTSIPVTRRITSQLPTKTRQTAGQKRERVATGEDSARGGPKRPTNGGSSNVGFGIYTSASGAQILNPGTSSQRILPAGLSYKDANLTGIDLGFKPRGLR
ncbi:hypothetical protein H5410_064584 [Solanum commersonii]|uniref:SWIM-type domain-containing protein n=1 Tax=Solanum commersonii TaxID=4109 RepID=A0A9J5VYX6_SOLCO|nr:hypothetical protein H5410_064584 [Solanum commersonii]